jgi:hypothetical protein
MIPSEIFQKIPKLPQRQDSVLDQLIDLHSVANRLGYYDAADFLKKFIPAYEHEAKTK